MPRTEFLAGLPARGAPRGTHTSLRRSAGPRSPPHLWQHRVAEQELEGTAAPWFIQTLVSDWKLMSMLEVAETPLEGLYAPVQRVSVYYKLKSAALLLFPKGICSDE